MPVTPTYPGVYVEEIPSGVHTITGVSTSVTAFVGAAKRGPIDRAVTLHSFADFERRFGGLKAGAELGYAVRQFFLNGGSEAHVVRIAKNAQAANRTLQNAAPADVLVLTALDEGKSGNGIQIAIDYDTPNPASTFNLVLAYTDPDDPSQSVREAFSDLSMNSADPRYVVDVLTDSSQLVSVQRVDAALASIAAATGTSVSGALQDGTGTALDVAALLDATHNRFQVVVDGGTPVPVVIDIPADVSNGATATTHLTGLCAAVQQKVRDVLGQAAFNCTRQGQTIVLESATQGEHSSVRVLPGPTNDAAARLKLGTANGGVETDAVAPLRPAPLPLRGTLLSGSFGATDLDGLPSPTSNSFQIGLDTYGPDTVTLDVAPVAAGGSVNPKIEAVAANIQEKVRALKPSNPAYRDFTAERSGTQLLLTSGTRGLGSAVQVFAVGANSIADALHLLTGTTATRPTNEVLEQGNEADYTDADVYNLVIADRAARKGLFALESVDIFNLLCLPGITDSGVIADAAAYCRERRAFLIVDAPRTATTPDAMGRLAGGPALPKTSSAAVYFPWVKTADPLRGGKPRLTPPSGTIAGLYARIDSTRGVWKAPAGIEASLGGVQQVDYPLTDLESGDLNPLGVNAIRLFPIVGPVAWGARTLRGADGLADEYKYVPVRRLALFLEESLYRGTQWVVFEPNDEPLWAQIRLNVGAFMQNLFRQGAFQGTTPQQAYLVKCDSETTTQTDIDLGIVNVLVGFAPLKPAEFVIIRIQQKAGQPEA
jgi:phage tail sheath protein FI